MGLQWKYEFTIMVDEAKKPVFHTKLIQYLTNAKTTGEILSAKGSCQPTEVPKQIEIT